MLGMGPLAATVAGLPHRDARRAIDCAPTSESRASDRDDVVIYAPDDATHGEWPTFTGDVAMRLMQAGVRFDMDRTLPPASYVNDLFNAYLCSHFDELASTGELPIREAVPAVILALASRGQARPPRPPEHGGAPLLVADRLGNLTSSTATRARSTRRVAEAPRHARQEPSGEGASSSSRRRRPSRRRSTAARYFGRPGRRSRSSAT